LFFFFNSVVPGRGGLGLPSPRGVGFYVIT